MLRVVGSLPGTPAATQRLTRALSSSSSPRVAPAAKRAGYAIPAQGFVFTALLLPVLGYTMYAGRYGPSDEEVEAEIRQRYAARIAENQQRNAAMADFFQHVIRQPDGTADDNLKEVLYAGKGGKKRLYAVDEKLYGTEEGVAEKKRQEEERKKREEYRRKVKAGEIIVEEPKETKEAKQAKNAPKSPDVLPPPPSHGGSLVVNAQSATLFGVVAILAAGVGFLAGGSRRS